MTAAERAREEGRREGLREAAELAWHHTNLLTAAGKLGDAAMGELALEIEQLAGPAQACLGGGEDGGSNGSAASSGAQETRARVVIVLMAHLVAREKFFREERGVYQPPSAAAIEEAKKEIRAALHRHRELTGDREKWRKESAVLAAGIGILYSRPHNGELEKEKKDHELSRGQKLEAGWLPKLYLELWRPWKCQRGKADPVPGFAELCFERRREGR